MMTSTEILNRLSVLKDIEVEINRGGYDCREKWAMKIVYNRNEGGNYDRIMVEAKHASFEHAVIEAWNKLELLALKGREKLHGQTVHSVIQY